MASDSVGLNYSPTPSFLNTGTTGYQSPAKMLVLSDGRILYVWSNDAVSDNLPSKTLQGRIVDGDGTVVTDQFTLPGLPSIDGFDGFDWDNLDVDLLNDGKVLVSYVQGTNEVGIDQPIFSIFQPTATGLTTVVGPTIIQTNDTTTY